MDPSLNNTITLMRVCFHVVIEALPPEPIKYIWVLLHPNWVAQVGIRDSHSVIRFNIRNVLKGKEAVSRRECFCILDTSVGSVKRV